MAWEAGEPRVPPTLQRSRLRAEEKTLDFGFEVVSAQFNRRGRYALRLTVENPLLRGSGAGVLLRDGSGELTRSCTSTTDTIEQSHPRQVCSFQRKRFVFTLPRGFCKNDKNHDVRLHIEALRFPRGAEGVRGSRRVGEAFFAIYPRTNQPRMKASAGRGEAWYHYSAATALLRVGSEQPAMHCGRLAFTASLHEHRAPTTGVSPPSTQQATAPAPDITMPGHWLPTPMAVSPALPTKGNGSSPERLQAGHALSSSLELPGDSMNKHPSSSSSSSSSMPVPASPRRSSFHLSSPGSSPDLASSPTQVSESPAGLEEPRHTWGAGRGHVAHMGKESITITLHGASNLPATRDGRVPWPYVIVKTIGGDEQKAEARATHVSPAPTHVPTWEEDVTVEMDAKDACWAALTLIVADKTTKEALGTFQLPVRHLQPFQPHHCRLVLFTLHPKQPRSRDPMGMVLYVSITRKRSFIPRCHGLSYVALEVLLRGMSAPLATPPGALVAVARVVTNVQEYKHCIEKHPIPWPSISPTTIPFPDPPAASFLIARAANHGCPQISRPARTPQQPTWDTSFLFQGRDVATIFSEDAALAIEYYPYRATWDSPGTLIPMGYSVLPLTSRVFRELAKQRDGMRVDGLPVQGTDLKTTTGATPTVGLCLQLLRSERPAALLTPSCSDSLPSLDTSTLERGEEPQAPPVHPFYCQLHQDNSPLPAAAAVGSPLPGKQTSPLRVGVPAEQQRSQVLGGQQEPVSAGGLEGSGGTGGHSGAPEVDPGSLGDRSQAAVSSTLPEVGNYQLALRRMAGDLLSLRQHVASLEVENRQLWHRVAWQEELGQGLLSDTDLDVLTREELLDRLATLKHKLVASTAERRSLKDRVQQLQNELIRKNDREQELVLLQRAHQQQQAWLRRCQGKVAKAKGLEEMVRQQEQVMGVMERMLREKLAGGGRSAEKPAGEALSKEAQAVLLAENCRLREELARPPHSLPPIALRPPASLDGFGGAEKLCLLARLEEAQARGRALERQLEEAARRWGREKQELGTRLLEQEHGLPRTPTLQNLPVLPPLRRPHPLPPLP